MCDLTQLFQAVAAINYSPQLVQFKLLSQIQFQILELCLDRESRA